VQKKFQCVLPIREPKLRVASILNCLSSSASLVEQCVGWSIICERANEIRIQASSGANQCYRHCL